MARINVDDHWWVDPRRQALTERFGGDPQLADGIMLTVWRIAQDYWKHNHERIPNHVFEHVRGGSKLIECGLAIASEQGVYVRGSAKHFEWIELQQANASKAGKISAQKRKELYGTSQPLSNDSRTPVRTEPNAPNDIERSYSSSSSSSSSSSNSGSNSLKTKKGIPERYTQDFESLWVEYGRHGDKKESFKVFQSLKLPPDEQNRLMQAITKYVGATPEVRYRKHLNRFLRSDWGEVLDAPQQANGVTAKPDSIHEHNKRMLEKYLLPAEVSNESES